MRRVDSKRCAAAAAGIAVGLAAWCGAGTPAKAETWAATPAPSVSQPPAATAEGGPPAAPDGDRPGDDLRETITLLFLTRMKSELDLTKQQYEQIVPKVDERERARRQGFEDHAQQSAKIRQLLATDTTRDSEFTEAVDRMVSLDDADRKKDDAFMSDVRRILTPRQQAKFMLFRQRFRMWLENRMRDARQFQGRGQRGHRGPKPDDPPDRGADDAPETPRTPGP